MKVTKTTLNDALVIEPLVHQDNRGYFFESYHAKKYHDIGITANFVQDNLSRSSYGVLRGLHLQKNNPQGKLVSVIRGKILDVIVDCRKDSSTFGQWNSIELSFENKLQLWVPPGFAHGFVSLDNESDVFYKCTALYDPADEVCIRWDDKFLNIRWPTLDYTISEKDSNGAQFEDVFK